MALVPGIRLGPYEIATQIDVGGMGKVYQATDPKLDFGMSRSRCCPSRSRVILEITLH